MTTPNADAAVSQPKPEPSKPAAKRAAPAKQVGPKAAPPAPGQAASIAIGQQLLDAKGLSAKARAIATRLSKDQPVSHKDLVTLRDEVKASAAALREANKAKDARTLSRCNRAVRRLERAARKGR